MGKYKTQMGETWDVISLRVYGSELYTSVLIAANWEHRDTAVFSTGAVLHVPDITTAQRLTENTPPWRRP